MKGLIVRNINARRVLLLFVLTTLVYTLMLTVTIPKVMSFSGGLKILDMIPTGYNAEYVDSLLNTLGVKGREAYLFNQIPLDMIYPLLFGITYCLILAYILKKLDKLEGYSFYVCFLPLFSGLFDYFENIGIITILNTYPNNSNRLTEITNVFSILKSSFTTISFFMLITFLILLGIRKLFAKTNGINK